MTPPVPATLVAVAAGVEADFRKRHRKDAARAGQVWESLVDKRAALLADSGFGPIFTPPKTPPFFRDIWPLRVLKVLPFAFRAVYTVFRDPQEGLVVQIEWVGDHKEYEALFGYSSS